MSSNRDASSLANIRNVSIEFLREAFDYDPEAGTIKWRERPLKHFASVRGMNTANARRSGKEIGRTPTGYARAEVTVGDRIYVLFGHHIAWKLSGREFVDGQIIDHRNRRRSDNRIDNLRQIGRRGNTQNRNIDPCNTTGVAGVAHHTDGGYVAQITVNYEHIYLGYFKDLNEAAQVRREAELKYFGEYAPEHDEQPAPLPPYELTPEDELWVNSIGNL